MKQVKDKFLTYSIIIPVSNRPEGLQTTLRGVFATRQPENTIRNEVVVVNDGSWPDVSKLIATHPQSEKITEVRLPKQSGPATARNRGVEKVTGDWLVFFDDGMEIPEDWLVKAFPYTKDYDYLAFDIKVKPREGESDLEKFFRLKTFQYEKTLKIRKFGGTGVLMVKQKLFKNIGGFDEKLKAGEDMVFGKVAFKIGAKQKLVPGVTALHQPKSLLTYLKDKRRDFKSINKINKLYNNLSDNSNSEKKSFLIILKKFLFHNENHPRFRNAGLKGCKFVKNMLLFKVITLLIKIQVTLESS